MKIAVEEKKLVMGLYCVTMLMSMLSIVDNVPFLGVMYNVKYLYMVIITFLCLYDGILIWNKRMAVGIGLLIIHTILYGVVFTNPSIQYYIDVHVKQLMGIYILTLFTCMYVYKKDCYRLFLESSYLALALFILWCAITHLGNFVNPVYFVKIFSRLERYRAHFGMGDVNFCGNYCIYLLLISFFLWCQWRKEKKIPKTIWLIAMIGTDIIALWVLFSTASRSAILSLVLFFGCYGILSKKQVLIRNWKLVLSMVAVLIVVLVLALVPTGVLADIWLESNREGNFSINYPIFQQYGNYLNGMGYVDNSGFLGMVYGYPTTAMDVYFLYIPFSTGILGSVLIFGQMIYLLYQLLRHSNTEGRDLALSLFVMMLYYAIWQVNYMNGRYYTGIIHMIILFIFLMKINEEEDVYVIKIQRR